jgi:hypothetical protein
VTRISQVDRIDIQKEKSGNFHHNFNRMAKSQQKQICF